MDELYHQGFNPQLLTLFIWEGVTFYLNPATVKNMLKLLHANSAAHSMIGFDFQSIHHGQGLIDTGLKDEAITFGVESGVIGSYLKDLGYAIIEHLNSDEICKRFLICSDGSLFGCIKPMMNIVLAETIH